MDSKSEIRSKFRVRSPFERFKTDLIKLSAATAELRWRTAAKAAKTISGGGAWPSRARRGKTLNRACGFVRTPIAAWSMATASYRGQEHDGGLADMKFSTFRKLWSISGYLELRLMVMTSLTTSWRVVAPARTPGGAISTSSLSLSTSDWEMGFIVHILGFFDWASGNR
ncbi:hypothetical protein DY000_02034822 [Brassica cretica]|uniref:Uncharacterized protein n=1 Tax=Brassica cretica TaxID=69181 RepID=A0ABQ7DP11_BRACR|nr:hypothetical protein DY000_02034822 [Brassica cretica]